MPLYDLIIIGGGPAGIAAGIYAARQRLNTLLITKSFGGQIVRKAVAIENYPGFEEISGLELIKKFEKHLRKQKIGVERDSVAEIKKAGKKFVVSTGRKNQFEAKAVIIASGADPRSLGIMGEKKFIGRGISYCIACDASLFSDKIVAVIGGGNSGFEAATALSDWAKRIYILEGGPKVFADETNQERVKKTGKVKIITNAVLKEILGDKFVSSLVYQDRKSGREKTLPVKGVFVEIGSRHSTLFAKGLVDLNEKDEIKVELETCQTKTPGLFAAGDCNIGRYKQIVIAAGEGAKAALAAYNYLQNSK